MTPCYTPILRLLGQNRVRASEQPQIKAPEVCHRGYYTCLKHCYVSIRDQNSFVPFASAGVNKARNVAESAEYAAHDTDCRPLVLLSGYMVDEQDRKSDMA